MKNVLSLIVVLFMLLSCGDNKEISKGFITVDITKNYPKKELIIQDFMDVEYVPLETNDEFLCEGFVQDVGNKYIIVRNFKHTGDIFIFDRQGRAVKKFNRRGQGGEEYVLLLEVVLDEKRSELFVNDWGREIVVYDLDGNYKRSFKAKENAKYRMMRDFNEDYLICYDELIPDGETEPKQAMLLVSKQDGQYQEIKMPFEKKIVTAVLTPRDKDGMVYGAWAQTDYPFVPYQKQWILMEPSCDTLYALSQELQKKPLIIRDPSIQTMNPEKFLFLSIVTDRYCFMEIVTKTYNFGTKEGFPRINLVYDRQVNEAYHSIVYNGDYNVKEEVQMNYIPLNQNVASCHIIPANELLVAYQKGWLKDGRLKEIAAGLDEESNPVLMFYKHK